MGLRRRTDGTAKPAWDEWIAAIAEHVQEVSLPLAVHQIRPLRLEI